MVEKDGSLSRTLLGLERYLGRARRDWHVLGVTFSLSLFACSSHTAEGEVPSATASAGSSGASGAPTAGGGAAGGANAATAGSTPAGGSGVGAAPVGGMTGVAGASGGGGSSDSGAGGDGAALCRNDVPEAEWEANCLACAGEDACGACLCTSCSAQIKACDATEGCKAIAECTRSSGCQGIACYCGTDAVDVCASGGGNGPCKETILAAPGGRAPTLAQPSAGPAADALAQVATCMQSTCGAACN